MNVSDMEIALAVLRKAGWDRTAEMDRADAILVNTCAIRENAEQKVWDRLRRFRALKRERAIEFRRARGSADALEPPVVGVLGCMAERLKGTLLEGERLADLVAGPDAYRDLPRLLSAARGGGAGVEEDPGSRMNVQLSLEETYADITPVRASAAFPTAFVSVMRGCNNMCSFCIVPFTRGRERSRPIASVEAEVRELVAEGYREVTLLGQNVNSYADDSEPGRAEGWDSSAEWGAYSRGFRSVYKPRREGKVRFAELVDRVAAVDPELRVRYTSPHPKDFPDELLAVMAARPNVCPHVHLPLQSGSSAVLERMRRGYTREAYLELVERIRARVPNVSLSTDLISGFCGETEADHALTLDAIGRVGFDQAFMFKYSRREKTGAARKFEDDVPEETKQRRLQEVIDAFNLSAEARAGADVGQERLVLVEGPSRKEPETKLVGKTCNGKRAVFAPAAEAAPLTPGDYAVVKVDKASSARTIRGNAIRKTTLVQFYADERV